MRFRNRIKSIITEKNITIAELTRQMQVDRSAVVSWCNNKDHVDRLRHPRLSEIIQTPENEIFLAEDSDGNQFELKKLEKKSQ